MKIGIDARFLTHPQHGGFKTYTTNLINAISQIDTEDQFYIYLDRSISENDALPQKANFIYRIVDGTLPIIGMPFREQYSLPKQIAQDRLDVFHSLCNTAPIIKIKNRIVTLHDTIQITKTTVPNLRKVLAQQKQWAIRIYSKFAIQNSLKNTERIITVSRYEKNQISKQVNFPLEKIFVTHLAADPSFKPVSEHQKGQWREEFKDKYQISGKIILGIGYEERKNIPLLIEAFSLLVPAHKDLRLVIVSANKDYKQAFNNLIAEYKLKKHAIILGNQPPSELVKLYNLASVFVFPSERESFGLPPLEAISCGAPTIAMDATSLPEILDDGAILIEGKNPLTWASEINRILSDQDLKKLLVQRGLKRSKLLTWENCAQKTLQVYKSMLDEEGN